MSEPEVTQDCTNACNFEIKDAGHDYTDNGETADIKDFFTPPKIDLNEEFSSFVELRAAIEKYQKDRSVQLIVKDSKLLEAESTRKVIPKVYHLVNQSLIYHSITYCCKCHGTLKQKPNSRIKNAGAKRLNCPMYFRLRLSPDLQKLVIFDMKEEHNHAIDPNTCQMAPRQQIYALSKSKKGEMNRTSQEDMALLLDPNVMKDENCQPTEKKRKLEGEKVEDSDDATDAEFQKTEEGFYDPHLSIPSDHSDSPLDSDSSSSEDSDEDFYITHGSCLPFPTRLIGSAIQASPDLIEASKNLIELQKSNLILAKSKLQLKNRKLELETAKLELEVRMLEKNNRESVTIDNNPDTTIYLHTT